VYVLNCGGWFSGSVSSAAAGPPRRRRARKRRVSAPSAAATKRGGRRPLTPPHCWCRVCSAAVGNGTGEPGKPRPSVILVVVRGTAKVGRRWRRRLETVSHLRRGRWRKRCRWRERRRRGPRWRRRLETVSHLRRGRRRKRWRWRERRRRGPVRVRDRILPNVISRCSEPRIALPVAQKPPVRASPRNLKPRPGEGHPVERVSRPGLEFALGSLLKEVILESHGEETRADRTQLAQALRGEGEST